MSSLSPPKPWLPSLLASIKKRLLLAALAMGLVGVLLIGLVCYVAVGQSSPAVDQNISAASVTNQAATSPGSYAADQVTTSGHSVTAPAAIATNATAAQTAGLNTISNPHSHTAATLAIPSTNPAAGIAAATSTFSSNMNQVVGLSIATVVAMMAVLAFTGLFIVCYVRRSRLLYRPQRASGRYGTITDSMRIHSSTVGAVVIQRSANAVANLPAVLGGAFGLQQRHPLRV